MTRPGYRGQPGYESGATPASEFPPPATGTLPAPPPRPAEGVTRREAAEIRRCALGNAAEVLAHSDFRPDADDVVAMARTFEEYLLNGSNESSGNGP